MGSAAKSSRSSTTRTGGHPEGGGDRARMIAETAYFLAQQRGFEGGDPVRDWLEAERMVDALPAGTPKRKKRT